MQRPLVLISFLILLSLPQHSVMLLRMQALVPQILLEPRMLGQVLVLTQHKNPWHNILQHQEIGELYLMQIAHLKHAPLLASAFLVTNKFLLDLFHLLAGQFATPALLMAALRRVTTVLLIELDIVLVNGLV